MTIAGVPIRAALPWLRAYLLITLIILFWKGFFFPWFSPLMSILGLFFSDRSLVIIQNFFTVFAQGLLPWPDRTLYTWLFPPDIGFARSFYMMQLGRFPGYVYLSGLSLLQLAQIVLVISFARRILKVRRQAGGSTGLRIEVALLHLPTWLIPLTMTFGIVLTLYVIHVAIMVLTDGGVPPPEFFQRWYLYIGLFFGIMGTLVALRFNASASQTVMAIANGSSLAPQDPLAQRVQALAARIGLPPVAVTTMPHFNAFAAGSGRKTAAVMLGRPLIAELAPDEVDAVIGHELGHIVSADMNRIQLAMGFEAMFDGFACGTAAFTQASVRDRQAGQLAAIGIHLVRMIVLLSSTLFSRYVSRAREYRADAIGAALSSPDAMVRALERVHGIKRAPAPVEEQYGYLMFRGGGISRMFSTHPTLEQRVRKLRKASHRVDIGS